MVGVAQVGVGKKRLFRGNCPGLQEGGARIKALQADFISFPGPLSARPDPLSLIRVEAETKIGLLSLPLSKFF